MILESLQVIGEVISERDFAGNEYAKYYTASDISGGDKAITSVVAIQLQRENGVLSYNGVKLIDPESSPEETALKHGYSLSSNVTDNSLTKRATGTSTSTLTKRLPKMLDDWFDPDVLDEHIDHPLIQSVRECVGPDGDARSRIEADLENIDDRVEYRALLTISVTDENGEEQFAGDIEAFNEGLRRWAMRDMRSKSTAKSCFGETRCTVCDNIDQCFGLGAKLDEMYSFKKQWPFPEYNSSNAWQSRPLCIECLTAIEVAVDRFIDAQNYGPPGVRCRVLPYALPIDRAEEQLRELIRNSQSQLVGAGGEREQKRPISAAWEAYRGPVELDLREDALRLALVYYVSDSAKTHGVAWIDGVSTDQLAELKTTAGNALDESPVFKQKLLPKPDAPSERRIFTGMWLFGLLTEKTDSNHEGESTGDDSKWAEYTERLLTNGTIPHDTVVASVVREARARWRARLEDEENYPYDGFHIANAYAFLRTCAEHGVLRDARTEHSMKPELLDGEYISFGAGLKEFVDAHPSIATSPGRKAGFILGAAAAQLSNWQIRRGLNRTFVQNRDVARLTTERLTEWQTYVWEKAKTYNAQAGNYGVPWSDAESLFHEAVLTGENEGWNATNDEIRYHYILGVNVGPNVARRAREDRDDSESSDPLPDPEQTAEATDQQ
ncbi:hypothetical protein BRC68_04000 [Halobacteriales archaeon QH_6_64_20]|nr:MAG: hypothetical protein BRC68_04000 [Halobacteriales archaeon QH_6_64_20]